MNTLELIKALVGTKIGKYEVRSYLDQGGMAAVYVAWHPDLKKEIILKVLLPVYAQDPKIVNRFRREAEEASNLNHPNIIRIYDAGEADGQYYIAMEYVRAGTLKDLLVRQGGQPLDMQRILSIITQMANALDYAHRREVVHRDVKPSNILLTEEGRAILTDFGIALPLQATRLTADMTTVGTPEYMSPEQAQGEENINACSDIYSLGIVLYEMLAGRPPFRADTPWAVVHKHIYEPLPPLRGVPGPVEKVVQRAMSKDPAQRYATAEAMAHDLRRAIVGLPGGLDTPSTGRKTQNKTLLWVGVAALAALLVVAAIVVLPLLNHPNTPTPTEIGSVSNTPALTSTPVPASTTATVNAPEPTITWSPTPTFTPTDTDTPTPTPTDTDTPTPTPTVKPTETFTPSPTSVPTIAPGDYTINRSDNTPLFGTYTLTVTTVRVREQDRMMKFNVCWRWDRDPNLEGSPQITKGSDAGNRAMYITDNRSIQLNHTDVGGAAAQDTVLESGVDACGWFLFPPPPEGAYEFTFHDDELLLTISGIRLTE